MESGSMFSVLGRTWRAAILLGLTAGGAGCTWLPAGRLEDCRKECQALRTESARWKDVATNLRHKNSDLALRAVEDARQIRRLDEANRRLDSSILAYQEEFERISHDFAEIESQVQATAMGPATAWVERLRVIARAHPGAEVDPDRLALRVPVDRLFDAGSAEPTPEATSLLDAIAATLADPSATDFMIRVNGPVAPPTVRRAGTDTAETAARPGLDLERTRRVGDRLQDRAGGRVVVTEPAPASDADNRPRAARQEVEIRWVARADGGGS
jgi:hypothetical protein